MKKFVPTEEQIKAECQQRARYFWNWLTWSLDLLCGNKPVFSSCKLVYKSTLLVGIMGYSRLGNQPADNSHREKYQILTNHKLKRKTLWKKEN